MRPRFIANSIVFLALMLWANLLVSQIATVAITWPNGGGLGRGTIRLDLNGGDNNGGYSISRNYGEFSTAQGIAAGFGGRISLESRSPVWARGNRDGTVSMWWRGTSGLTSISACITPSGATNVCTTLPGASVVTSMTGVQPGGGADPPPVISSLSSSHAAAGSQITIYGTDLGYDTDDTSVTLNGVAMDIASVDPDAVVVLLRSTDTSGSIVAKVSGVTSNAVPFTVDPGASSPVPGTVLYSYNISTPSGTSGYDATGNITAYTDSVNKTWSIQYDNLNRLKSATQSSTDEQFYTPWGFAMQQSLCWTYDDFGNRPVQVLSSQSFTDLSTCATPATATTSQTRVNFDSSSNRVTTPGYVYNADGSLQTDGKNSYFYDGSGRLCAVEKNVIGAYTAYLYDADGNRVGKGNAFPPGGGDPCDFGSNQFQLTNEYFLDSAGRQLTEFDAQGNWLRTNEFSGEALGATYNSSGLHYRLNDWLGTARLEFNAANNPEHKYSDAPFGDALNSADGSSDLIFTGKERDAESGLDYFGARYYGSSMGRFMSPDSGADATVGVPVPYAELTNPQSLNLYSYVGNNPLSNVDPDGHDYRVCADNGNGGQNCVNLTDDQFNNLVKQQNGQQGINFKGGFPSGSISCGGSTCGSYSYFEKGLVDESGGQLASIALGMGIGKAVGAAYGAIAGFFGRGAGEAAGAVAETAASTGKVLLQAGTKQEAKAVVEAMVEGAQKQAAKRALARAGSNASVSISESESGLVRIEVTRPGFDGTQTMTKAIDPAGNTTTVQAAHDASGSLVHFDPKSF